MSPSFGAARSWRAPRGSGGGGSPPCSRSAWSCRRRTRTPCGGVGRGRSHRACVIGGLACVSSSPDVASERQIVEIGVVGRSPLGSDPAARGDGAALWLGVERALLVARSTLEVDDRIGGDLERRPRLAVAAFELAG